MRNPDPCPPPPPPSSPPMTATIHANSTYVTIDKPGRIEVGDDEDRNYKLIITHETVLRVSVEPTHEIYPTRLTLAELAEAIRQFTTNPTR